MSFRETVDQLATRMRSDRIIRKIKPFLISGERVLDIGAGGCGVAQSLIDRAGVQLVPIDVVDHNKSSLHLELYDGETLPYPDNSFDTSLLIFVLHHAAKYARVLQEAQRVSPQVIVMEDTPQTAFERYAWAKADYAMNHAVHDDIDIAQGTKTPEEWRNTFGEEGLKVAYQESFRSVILTGGLYPHTMFVLEHA